MNVVHHALHVQINTATGGDAISLDGIGKRVAETGVHALTADALFHPFELRALLYLRLDLLRGSPTVSVLSFHDAGAEVRHFNC